MLGLFRGAVHTVADHLFSVMLEGHHEVRKHTVYLSTSRVAAFMPRNVERLTLALVMTDRPFTVIPKDERAFFAHGTKEFTAVR